MHSADYAVERCLFVRLSVTRRYFVEMVIHILKLFPPSGSHNILVFFRTKRHGNIPTMTLMTATSNARGYEKIEIFDQCLTLSRK